MNAQIQTIDHFILQLDEGHPILVKNTTATLFIQGTATNHSIQLKAVDLCAQKGEALVVAVNTSPNTVSNSISSSTSEYFTTSEASVVSTPLKVVQNGACGGKEQ